MPHPEHLAFSQEGRTAIVFDDEGDLEIVDLLLVVSLGFEGVTAES